MQRQDKKETTGLFELREGVVYINEFGSQVRVTKRGYYEVNRGRGWEKIALSKHWLAQRLEVLDD